MFNDNLIKPQEGEELPKRMNVIGCENQGIKPNERMSLRKSYSVMRDAGPQMITGDLLVAMMLATHDCIASGRVR